MMSNVSVMRLPDSPSPSRQGARPPWAVLAAALTVFLLYGAAAIAYMASLGRTETIAGLRACGRDVGGVPFAALEGALRTACEPALDETLLLTVGDEKARGRRRDAGFTVDVDALSAAARRAGRSGSPFADLMERRR